MKKIDLMDDDNALDDMDDDDCPLKILYPFGQSLDIDPKRQNISTLFTSGKIAYPMNRPLCAVTTSRSTRGKLCVFGSINFLNNKSQIRQRKRKKFFRERPHKKRK